MFPSLVNAHTWLRLTELPVAERRTAEFFWKCALGKINKEINMKMSMSFWPYKYFFPGESSDDIRFCHRKLIEGILAIWVSGLGVEKEPI